MIRSLSTAATGMQAQEAKLNQLAADMSNMNTNAYKRGRTEFKDLVYQTIKEAGGEPGQNPVPVGIQVGSGVRAAAQFSVHEQGPTKVTGRMLDLVIQGDGFFPVEMKDDTAGANRVGYTRDGAFKLDGNGRVLSTSGHYLVPSIQVPREATGVTVAPNGEVKAQMPSGEQTLGQIQIYTFISPEALTSIGSNLFKANEAAGPAVGVIPGENGTGTIQQGAIEGSNVKPTEAVMDMITTQRTYESNARIMSVGDQMWSTTNNIGK